MKQNSKFVSVKIKDFKSIKEMSVPLNRLNEFYGPNKTGKSSVLEAIHFCCKGGKNDVNKIRVGADKAVVEIEAIRDDVPIWIKTAVNRKGNVSCRAKCNGIEHHQPRSLIMSLLSLGTFNPRELLDPAGREDRLLKLVPIQITEKDLTLPEMDNLRIPLSDPGAIDYSKHAYHVISDVEKDVRNTRLTKGREFSILLKNHEKRKYDLEADLVSFKKHYDTDPLSLSVSYEGEVRDEEKNKSRSEELNSKISAQVDVQVKLEERIANGNRSLDFCKKARNEAERELADLKRKVEECDLKEKEYSKGVEELKNELKSAKEIERSLTEEKKSVDSVIAISGKKIAMARESSSIKKVHEEVKVLKKEADDKEKEWKSFDILIKKMLPVLKRKVLDPIRKKVIGLDIADGEFTYNGVPLDTLSGSEVVQLGIKLMSLQENANMLLINEAECMDEESFKETNFDDFSSVIVARVATEPLKGKWKSVEMKSQTASDKGGQDEEKEEK